MVTAKTYQNWKKIGTPFTKGDKPYILVRTKCDRCSNGVFVSRIENGQPIPHPAYGGVCLKCAGSGYIEKEVRLYKEEELNAIEMRNEANKKRKEAARLKEMEENFSAKKAEWLKNHGFNENGITYVIKGETYSIKDELKAEGFIFDSVLLWHRSEPLDEFMEDNIPIKAEEVLEFSAWGEGHYLTGAKEKIQNLVNPPSASNSEWLDIEKGDSFKNIPVTFIKRGSYLGKFGLTNILTFETEEGNILTWFTTTEPKVEIGDNFFLSGKVKDKNEYKGIKSTIVTRCHIS